MEEEKKGEEEIRVVGKNVLKPVKGRGMFISKPLRVESSSVFEGMVWKRPNSWLSDEEVHRFITLHRNYVQKLKEIGIKVPKTIIQHAHSGKDKNKARPSVFQEPVGKVVAHYLTEKECDNKKALELYRRMLTETLKVIKYNFQAEKKGEVIVGLDSKPLNWALKEEDKGELYFIDTIPPFLREVDKLGIYRDVMAPPIEYYPPLLQKIFILYPNLFHRCVGVVYYPPSMVSRLLHQTEKLRPELRQELRKITFDEVSKALPEDKYPSLANSILKKTFSLSYALKNRVEEWTFKMLKLEE